MTNSLHRRRLLQLSASGSALALLAGCLGSDDDDGDDDHDDHNGDDHNDDGDDDHDDGGDDEPAAATFEVSDLEPDALTIDRGDAIDVSATITNTGEQDGEQDVELRVDGETLEVEPVSLSPGDETTVEFEGVDTEALETGSHTFGVYSDDDDATGTITVQEFDPDAAYFEVSDLDPEELSIELGDAIDVSATVTNTGEQDGEQDVELRVDGETLASETVSLEPDDETTVAFEGVDTDGVSGGEHTFGVYSNNDNATGTITVDDPYDGWGDVERIEVDGQRDGWIGIVPEQIEGEENPTITLIEGREYELGWPEGDGMFHNIEIRDENNDVVNDLSTDPTSEPGEDQFLEFVATDEMAYYVCMPHPNDMIGEIEVVE